jgi:hypothetical protein
VCNKKRKKHLWGEAKNYTKPIDWTVVSVEETDREEEVYCVVSPTGAFTLEDNIFTGNCSAGCIKAGQGAFIHLLKTWPERYKMWEEREKRDARVSSERGYHLTGNCGWGKEETPPIGTKKKI